MQIAPKHIAEVAIESIRRDVRFGVVGRWTDVAKGRLSAVASITQDPTFIGWSNEAWFLTGAYTDRHGKRWGK